MAYTVLVRELKQSSPSVSEWCTCTIALELTPQRHQHLHTHSPCSSADTT